MPPRAARWSALAEPAGRALSSSACPNRLRNGRRLRRRGAIGTAGHGHQWRSWGRAWRGRPSPGRRRDEDLLERFELLEALATPDRHAVEGIASDHDGHA